ncbi:MBL fold metallo-hydrolase [Pseudobutyrivibrio sp. ACV-2]|uniref:MBL fold metallo-hydrolase n=1 Tax=Pseudobutyrivibrio sp. ACV-2 TaxID=1520801 RepID=UPI0011153AD2|nr:MBL fold metallo-hydrolase [Pseudobutyrivibrio sp. ACV-2]
MASVPIGGTYIMDAKKAAEYVNELNPNYVIPVHYGSIVDSKNDAAIFKDKVKSSINVAIKLSF